MSVATQVPREFIGLARELRQALAVDDIIAYSEAGRIASPFAPIIRSGAVPRPEMLARAASTWQLKVPSTGRLKLEIDLKKKSLQIRELRALAADARFAMWGEGETELGFALAAMGLDMGSPHDLSKTAR